MADSYLAILRARAIDQKLVAKPLPYRVIKFSFKCWQQKARTTVGAKTSEAAISPLSLSLIRVVSSVVISGIANCKFKRKYSQEEVFPLSTTAQARSKVWPFASIVTARRRVLDKFALQKCPINSNKMPAVPERLPGLSWTDKESLKAVCVGVA